MCGRLLESLPEQKAGYPMGLNEPHLRIFLHDDGLCFVADGKDDSVRFTLGLASFDGLGKFIPW